MNVHFPMKRGNWSQFITPSPFRDLFLKGYHISCLLNGYCNTKEISCCIYVSTVMRPAYADILVHLYIYIYIYISLERALGLVLIHCSLGIATCIPYDPTLPFYKISS